MDFNNSIFYDIFISYSHNDIIIAEKIAKNLIDEGFIVFFDKYEVSYGQNIEKSIERALENSLKILYIISPNSIDSKWIPYEIDYYWNEINLQNEIKLLPLIIKKCKMPKKIEKLKAFDFTNIFIHTTTEQIKVNKKYKYKFKNLVKILKNINYLNFGPYKIENNKNKIDNLIKTITGRILLYFKISNKIINKIKSAYYELVSNGFEHPKVIKSELLISLYLRVEPIHVILQVTDNGKGFNLSKKIIKNKILLDKNPLKSKGRGLLLLANSFYLYNKHDSKNNRHCITAVMYESDLIEIVNSLGEIETKNSKFVKYWPDINKSLYLKINGTLWGTQSTDEFEYVLKTIYPTIKRILIDLQNVDTINSSCIGKIVLYQTIWDREDLDRKIAIFIRPNSSLEKTFTLIKYDRIIPIYYNQKDVLTFLNFK